VGALMASRIAPKRISQDALRHFLLFGSVSEPVTMYEACFRWPPGIACCFMFRTGGVCRVRIRGGIRAGVQRRKIRADRKHLDGGNCCGRCLEDSVRAHLIADVPVGLFFCRGGLDSGANRWAGPAASIKEFQSFTLAFPGTAYDESR